MTITNTIATTLSRRLGPIVLSGFGLATLALAGTCAAQSWPAKPIRAIVPFSVGSTIDIIGRIVAEPLAVQLGQQIVIENRGGAGGTIGTNAVVQAEPDGYTLLIHASAHSAAPASLMPSCPTTPPMILRAWSCLAMFRMSRSSRRKRASKR